VDAEWKTLQPEISGRRSQGSANPSRQPLPVSAAGMFVSNRRMSAQLVHEVSLFNYYCHIEAFVHSAGVICVNLEMS